MYARSGGEFTVTVPMREYELAARLLVQAVAADRGGQAAAALQAAAWKLGADLAERHQAGQDGPRPALEDALKCALSEHGYEPGQDEAGTIRMRSCPFRRLAELEPALVCHMNLALIQGLTAGLGAGRLHPVLDPEPEHCCVAVPAATPDPNGNP